MIFFQKPLPQSSSGRAIRHRASCVISWLNHCHLKTWYQFNCDGPKTYHLFNVPTTVTVFYVQPTTTSFMHKCKAERPSPLVQFSISVLYHSMCLPTIISFLNRCKAARSGPSVRSIIWLQESWTVQIKMIRCSLFFFTFQWSFSLEDEIHFKIQTPGIGWLGQKPTQIYVPCQRLV